MRIEWRHDGRRIILPVAILRPEPTNLTSIDVLALVDTGATTSGIVKRIADALELPPAGKRPLYVARGVIQVERYLFRVGLRTSTGNDGPAYPYIFEETLGFELSDTTSLPNGRRLDAVLGMDVLGACDLSIARDGTCRLTYG